MNRADYAELLEAQGRCCAICGKPPNKDDQLVVDHCHRTGVVRGLLHNSCNAGIGLFRDDPDALIGAVAYLQAAKPTNRLFDCAARLLVCMSTVDVIGEVELLVQAGELDTEHPDAWKTLADNWFAEQLDDGRWRATDRGWNLVQICAQMRLRGIRLMTKKSAAARDNRVALRIQAAAHLRRRHRRDTQVHNA